jgi:hypothetical protein
MNIAELTTELATELRRPDMIDRIRGFVRQVVTHCHAATEFQRDLVEEIVAVPSPAPVIKITQPPRLRRLISIAPCDALGTQLATANPEGGYAIKSPTDIVTMSGYLMTDIAYIAGPTITVRGSGATHLFLQYYQTPDLQDELTQTWIMEQFPDLIKTGVRARYYQATNNQQAAGEAQLFQQDLLLLVSHFGGVN